MGALLSQISGSLGKAVASTFFPVVLFLSAFYVAVLPLHPYGLEIFRPFESIDAGWKVVAFSFCALLLTGVLWNINTLVYRFLEGYPWQRSLIGVRFRAAQVRQFQNAQATKAALIALIARLPPGSDAAKDAQRCLRNVAGLLEKRYPDRESLILPTRFGNVIRAFETYPRRQYQMSAIEMYPRLLAVVDQQYSGVINDAKTTVDFLVNACLLSTVLAAASLFFGLRKLPFGSWPETGYWLLQVVGFGLLANWFYSAAIGPTLEWGQHVRSAFDLYRSALLAKLGIAAPYATLAEERAIWHAVTDQMTFPDATPFPIPYKVTPPAAFARNGVPVSVVRAASFKLDSGATRVYLTVRNGTGKEAADVVVTDVPPSTMEYVHASLSASSNVTVRRTNPLEFVVPKVPANGTVSFQYEAITPGK